MNKFTFCGRLTKDPVLTKVNETLDIATFTIAIPCKEKKDGSTADFIYIKSYNKLANIVSQYLKKGSKVLINGTVKTGSYEDNGKTVYTTDFIAEEIYFL